MIHYHGGPITPEHVALHVWRGRNALISHWRPEQVELAASCTQTFVLDNGAFSAWRTGAPIADWSAYYNWVEQWRLHPAFAFAIIPDVIGGAEDDNDALVKEWPFGVDGVPVWHLDESIERLEALVDRWPRVALGSCAEYDASRPAALLGRLADALPAICDEHGQPRAKLHGLRMLNPAIFRHAPLASADSSGIARNIGLDVRWTGPYVPATKQARADVLLDRLAAEPAAERWRADVFPPQLRMEATS